ncbi:hypothetical protein GCM10009809_04900 [Isoptericola hypogeus]|uniref:DUF998 domain-containing protein n=1 Tax=Isoptericola hypogeus TaxID=300179 RepID=A0ABN2ITW1_9MICO
MSGAPAPVATARNAAATYHYLRVAIIGMTAMLVVAVLLEDADPASGVRLGSISASWYTPAQSIFVAVLVGTGAAMIAIRGRGMQEPLLNLAGFLAPVVAFVPTPEPVRETCFAQAQPPTLDAQQPPISGGPWDAQACAEWTDQVSSSLVAYFWVGSVALVLLLLFVLRRDRDPELVPTAAGGSWLRRLGRRFADTGFRQPSRNEEVVGTLVVVLVWVAGLLAYLLRHDWFLLHAHALAAIMVFAPMALVALTSGLVGLWRRPDASRPHPVWGIAYLAVAVLMIVGVVATAGFKLFGWVTDESRWFYWFELAIVLGFLLFWTFQTVEERGASVGRAAGGEGREGAPAEHGHAEEDGGDDAEARLEPAADQRAEQQA